MTCFRYRSGVTGKRSLSPAKAGRHASMSASLLLLYPLGACQSIAHSPTVARADRYIGSATIDAAGVLTLVLESRDGGRFARGIKRYAPSDPHYAQVLAHVGPIQPGETKPVRPWPDASK